MPIFEMIAAGVAIGGLIYNVVKDATTGKVSYVPTGEKIPIGDEKKLPGGTKDYSGNFYLKGSPADTYQNPQQMTDDYWSKVNTRIAELRPQRPQGVSPEQWEKEISRKAKQETPWQGLPSQNPALKDRPARARGPTNEVEQTALYKDAVEKAYYGVERLPGESDADLENRRQLAIRQVKRPVIESTLEEYQKNVEDEANDEKNRLAEEDKKYLASVEEAQKRSDFSYQGLGSKDYQDLMMQALNRKGKEVDFGEANLSRMLANDSRNTQLTSTQLYEDAAEGKAPSAAAIQQQQGLESAQRQQQSMAQSARGSLARAAAMRTSQLASGQLQAQGINEAALLRAKEMEAARAGFANAIQNQRTQDMNQQNIDVDKAKYVVDSSQKQTALNDSLALGMSQAEREAARYTQLGTTEYRKDIKDRQLADQNAKTAADNRNSTSAIQNQNAVINAGNSAFNALSQMSARTPTSTSSSTPASTPAPAPTTSTKTQSASQKDEENTGSTSSSLSSDNKYKSTWVKSDKNSKKNIKDGSEQASGFLDALKAYNYEYKDSKDGKGKRLGVMAQDLEKSKMGKRLVSENQEGEKVVDVGKSLPAVLASLATLNNKQKELEKALSSLKSKSRK